MLLDVPMLKVEEMALEVEDLEAHVSLQAEVLSLLKLQVGADVSLGRVSLDIKGVEAVAAHRHSVIRRRARLLYAALSMAGL